MSHAAPPAEHAVLYVGAASISLIILILPASPVGLAIVDSASATALSRCILLFLFLRGGGQSAPCLSSGRHSKRRAHLFFIFVVIEQAKLSEYAVVIVVLLLLLAALRRSRAFIPFRLPHLFIVT